MNHDIEVNWLINNFCNFDCIYCYPGSKKNTFIGLKDIKKVVDGFSKTGLKWLIYISGGEPFLFPNFVELCEKLTENHIISINSNLSHKDVFRFARFINPEKVRCFHCSLHIIEREKRNLVKDFIKKYKLLEAKGFYLYASYVLYPHLLNRFKKDYAYFKSKGIILRPKLFRGHCSKFKIINTKIFRKIRYFFEQRYPDTFSKRQKKIITSYIEQSQRDGNFVINHADNKIRGRLSDVWLDKLFINGLPSFKEQYCLTGKSFIRMTPTGEVYRCYDENTHLGNLFEGEIKLFKKPRRCISDFCSCPYIGYAHLLKVDREFDKSENQKQYIPAIHNQ